MNPNVVLKKIELDDLPKVAQVHISSFPESALTKLGAQIVERYYLWQLTGPHEKVWATGAFVEGVCAGFSFSGIFNGSTSGFIQRNKTFLIKQVLLRPQLLLNRLFLKRLTEGIRLLRGFAGKKPISNVKAETTPKLNYGILSIAVSAQHQKLGIGQMLMRDAENEALKCGYEQICLTVHPNNTKAVRFYEKQNWQKFLQSGLWNGAMTKLLK